MGTTLSVMPLYAKCPRVTGGCESLCVYVGGRNQTLQEQHVLLIAVQSPVLPESFLMK